MNLIAEVAINYLLLILTINLIILWKNVLKILKMKYQNIVVEHAILRIISSFDF